VWLLRRLNEEWGTAVLMAEHRLERCLPAADRVIAVDGGRVVQDSPPRDFLTWAAAERPALATPGARLFSLAGLSPLPGSAKEARAQLEAAGLMPGGDEAGEAAQRPRSRGPIALRTRGLWHELHDGPAILAGIDVPIAAGE